MAPEKSSSFRLIIVAGAGLIFGSLIAIFLWQWKTSNPPPPAKPSVILRLHGSNTIGAKLAPALAEEFLRQQGAKDVRTIAVNAEEANVQGILPDDPAPKIIEVQAHGSATAFTDLSKGSCDIGLASRKIKPDEIRLLDPFGDMTSLVSENVLGLDGIAIIVNRLNPIQTLTKEQIAKIFSGEITNWSQVPDGKDGQIKVYARDNKSGTYDTFKSLVLGDSPLVNSASRFEDSNALSDAVANDANGIGFIGLPYIRNAKAVAVSGNGSTPLIPNHLTVATEDYILSRRLFLYLPATSPNLLVRRFVAFALSKTGQDIVASNGFIAQNIVSENFNVVQNAPDEYKKLANGAERLSLDFRFRVGSRDLDNKAQRDLDRIVGFITDLHYSPENIMLFGFADNLGNQDVNLALSKERAGIVAEQFKRLGIAPATVTGFGSQLPVAPNDTEEGREKNRRVEVWVKK
jgi:phosphate transport system substrate-binding protein